MYQISCIHETMLAIICSLMPLPHSTNDLLTWAIKHIQSPVWSLYVATDRILFQPRVVLNQEKGNFLLCGNMETTTICWNENCTERYLCPVYYRRWWIFSANKYCISSQLPATILKLSEIVSTETQCFLTVSVQYFVSFPLKLFPTTSNILPHFLQYNLINVVNRYVTAVGKYSCGYGLLNFGGEVSFMCPYRNSDFFEGMFWHFH